MKRTCSWLVLWLAAALPAAAQYYEIKASGPTTAVYGYTDTVGDFNNNGFPDLVIAGNVVLDPGVSGILSSVTVPLPPPGGASSDAAGYINGDANLDLFGAYAANVFLGQGNGTFSSQPFPPVNAVVEVIRLADLDQDGLDDAILQLRGTGIQLQVFLNDSLQWTPGWSIQLPYIPLHGFSVAGDFNADGNKDLFWLAHPLLYPSGAPTPSSLFDQAYVAFGDGLGGFAAPATYPLGGPPPTGGANVRPLVVDLDMDGRSDIVMATGGVPAIRIFYGSPVSGLEPATFVSWPPTFGPFTGPGNGLWEMFAYDLDADGDRDLVRTGSFGLIPWPTFPFTIYSMAIDVLNGTGYRNWAASVRRDLILQPPAGALFTPADFDLDGDVDLIGVPSTAPNTLYLDNTALFGSGCPGTAGALPISAQGDLTLGNLGYFVLVHGAPSFAPAVFAVSLNKVPSPTCAIYVDPTVLLLPTQSFGFATTDASGHALLGLPLPGGTFLAGTTVYSQWFVADPAGALTVGGMNYAASQGRTHDLW